MNARAASDGAQAGNSHAPTAAPIDPIISTLPAAVVKAYQERFPRHRVWRSLKTGEGEAARYELTIFDPSSTVVHVQRVESGVVQSHLAYTLILSGTGEVIQEQQHPIPENAVPSAVRAAFERWKGPFGGGMWLGWFAYQEEGAERHYSVSVVQNALEGYGATFDGDGVLVKKSAQWNKDQDRFSPRVRTTFLRALHDSGLISFDEPLPLPWSTLAPRELVELEFPEIEQIYGAEAGVRDDCSCAKVEYTAPLPVELEDYSCHLLAPDGVSPLTLIALRGTVSLVVERSGAISRRTHTGTITAERVAGASGIDGGFVVCNPTGGPIDAAAGSVAVTDLVHSTPERPEKHHVLPVGFSDADQAFWTIASQYAFEIGSSKFVFIQWSPDQDNYELACEFRYSIAALTDPPEIVTWNNYGCDV